MISEASAAKGAAEADGKRGNNMTRKIKRWLRISSTMAAVLSIGIESFGQSPHAADQAVAASDPSYDGQPLSHWLRSLFRHDSRERRANPASREALLQIGTNALPLLLDWIERPRGYACLEPVYAVDGFEVLGPVGMPAVPDLIRLIGKNPNYPEQALVFIGKPAVPAMAAKLVETLSDTNNPYYFTGVRADIRRTSGFYIRGRILDVLNQIGTNAEAAIPALFMAATNYPSFPSHRFSGNPCAVLANVGQNRPEMVVPFLLNCFSDSTAPPWNRELVAQAMSLYGTNQAEAFMPVLIAALHENRSNDLSRIQIGAALAAMGSNQPNVLVPAFLSALTDQNNGEEIRCSLAGCLANVGRSQPDVVVPALMAAYTNCSVEGRSFIAGLLAGFGERSRSIVPVLMADSRSREIPLNRLDWKVGLASAAKRIAPDVTNTLGPLIEGLGSPDPGIQQWMIRAFGDLGTNGIDGVPALLRYLTNDTTQIRCDAIEALDAIGVKSGEYIANLGQLVSDTNYFVSHYAQSSLCSIATNSKLAFVTVLRKAIASPVEEDVRDQAKYRLIDISRVHPRFLLEALDYPDPKVRAGALSVFYELGQRVQQAIPVLRRLATNDPDANVRSQAADVLRIQLQ
jgi:HEAT repeat protein